MMDGRLGRRAGLLAREQSVGKRYGGQVSQREGGSAGTLARYWTYERVSGWPGEAVGEMSGGYVGEWVAYQVG